jgi:hypothetical protein
MYFIKNAWLPSITCCVQKIYNAYYPSIEQKSILINSSSIKINYVYGGITWVFSQWGTSVFNQLPTISISMALEDLSDSVYPLYVKIISITNYSVTIKAYKFFLDEHNDIVFSECNTNDIIIHITAESK